MKAIVTDWHGVVDRHTYRALREYIAQLKDVSVEQYKERLNGLDRQWTDGLVDPDVFWQTLTDLFQLTEDELLSIQAKYLSVDLDEGVVNILTEWKKTHPIGLLSDCPEDKALIIRRDPTYRLFSEAYFSCDKQSSKEVSSFFLDFSKAFGHPPEDCIFIDDQEKNTTRATSLGFTSILFTDAPTLSEALSKL